MHISIKKRNSREGIVAAGMVGRLSPCYSQDIKTIGKKIQNVRMGEAARRETIPSQAATHIRRNIT
jgi:hypothetical protein